MDERQFVAAITPFLRDMTYVALALLGPADADDAAQEALLRAWRAAPGLRDTAALRPWLLRITANVCYDIRRKRSHAWARLTALPADDAAINDGAVVERILGEDPGSSEAVARLDLRRLVDTLDEDMRIVLVLRYYAEMNATEIGAALNMSASAVRTRLQRALAQLRAAGGLPDATAELHQSARTQP
jgi:RNA polymerase sigma-70 factor, ECF subfamily